MNKLYEENDIQNIANSIRNKGVSGNFTVAQMASNIDNIPSGGGYDFKGNYSYAMDADLGGTTWSVYNVYITDSALNTGSFSQKIFYPAITRTIYLKGSSNLFEMVPNLINTNSMREFLNNQSRYLLANNNQYPVCGPYVETMYRAYYNMSSLIGAPVIGPNVTNITEAYTNCSGLTNWCEDTIKCPISASTFAGVNNQNVKISFIDIDWKLTRSSPDTVAAPNLSVEGGVRMTHFFSSSGAVYSLQLRKLNGNLFYDNFFDLGSPILLYNYTEGSQIIVLDNLRGYTSPRLFGSNTIFSNIWLYSNNTTWASESLYSNYNDVQDILNSRYSGHAYSSWKQINLNKVYENGMEVTQGVVNLHEVSVRMCNFNNYNIMVHFCDQCIYNKLV